MRALGPTPQGWSRSAVEPSAVTKSYLLSVGVDGARTHADLISNARKLITASHRILEQTIAIYKDAQATIQRLQEQRAQNRSTVWRPQRAGALRLLVGARIDEGRLPDTASRTVIVSGFGGQCEACDGYLPTTQLVEAISKGETFVYLHSECYRVWRLQCRLRAALRRMA